VESLVREIKMRHATLGIIVFAAAILLCAPARADFVGLTVVREFPNQQTAVGIRDVFRVYAEFTDPSDRVDTWYGTQANPFVIQNVLANGSPGSGFVNFNLFPFRPESPDSPQKWDTWATIGETYEGEGGGPSQLSWSPAAFPAFINGNSLTAAASVFLTGQLPPQGLGSFRVVGQDTATRVLLMQLTVLPGEHVQGSLSLGGRVMSGSEYESFVAASATFTSVPGPATFSAFLAVTLIRAPWCRRRIVATPMPCMSR